MAALAGLAPLPASPVDAQGALVHGRFAGTLGVDPVALGPDGGRVRRWRYVAAGDGDTIVGAAVVDLGFVGVAFAFASAAGRVTRAETTRPLGAGLRVGTTPAGGAVCRTRRSVVDVDGTGGFRLDVAAPGGRLRAEVHLHDPVTDATVLTATPEGGWNATVKAAGTPARGTVRIGDGPVVELGPEAGAWSDWTAGRQDRTTVWRWAAGAGVADDGRRVGLNASTGMNAAVGEDLVWWDGVPRSLPVDRLAPRTPEDPEGPWAVVSGDARLELDPEASRRAHEQLLVVTSSYVQPFGRWVGTLPAPDGHPTAVTLAGVAEDHLAVW